VTPRALAWLGLLLASACAGPLPQPSTDLASVESVPPEEIRLVAVYGGAKTEAYGPLVRPSAVLARADGWVWLADSGSGRMHLFDPEGYYDADAESPPFGDLLPLDLAELGFQTLVLDGGSRRVLRYDDSGAYRDVLLEIQALDPRARIEPVALAVDRDGRVAIADVAAHRVLLTGPFLDLDNSIGGFGGLPGQLDDPRGLCFGARGHLYVADRGNRRVQVFDRTGFLVGGTQPLGGTNELFVAPTDVAADRFGNLYVADPGRSAVVVLTPDLQPLTTIGEDEFAQGDLRRPVRCSVSEDDLLFVVDLGRNELVVFELLFP